MDNIGVFLCDRIHNNSKLIKYLFYNNSFEMEYKNIHNLADFHECNDEFINMIQDLTINFVLEKSTHISDMDESFEGGDESLYDEGRYCWEYYEFEGWFYYKSPEGEVNGLHRVGTSVIL